MTQTEVKNVPTDTTSPQQSLVPHRNTVPQGTNVPETKTLKVPKQRRGQNACVLQETNEGTVSQQNRLTFGPCNKGLMDPLSVCELSVQSATTNKGSADYMQKDEVTNIGSQSVLERAVQSVKTNEKLVPSQKTAPTPQPVSLHIHVLCFSLYTYFWVPLLVHLYDFIIYYNFKFLSFYSIKLQFQFNYVLIMKLNAYYYY